MRRLYQSAEDVKFNEEGRPIPDGYIFLSVYGMEGFVDIRIDFAVGTVWRDTPYALIIEKAETREFYPWQSIWKVSVTKNSKFYGEAHREWREKQNGLKPYTPGAPPGHYSATMEQLREMGYKLPGSED